MKKYLKPILGGASALFAVLVFVTMVGDTFAKSNLWEGLSFSWGSVYSALGGGLGVLIAALIFFLVGLIATCAATVLMVMKNKWSTLTFLGACLMLIVAGILYFCPATGNYSGAGLGAGSVLSAIFCMVSGLLAGAVGVLDILKK